MAGKTYTVNIPAEALHNYNRQNDARFFRVFNVPGAPSPVLAMIDLDDNGDDYVLRFYMYDPKHKGVFPSISYGYAQKRFSEMQHILFLEFDETKGAEIYNGMQAALNEIASDE